MATATYSELILDDYILLLLILGYDYILVELILGYGYILRADT